MMVEQTFRQLRLRGETALMPYITAGFPTIENSLEHLERLAAGGADLIEIGVPFSDPVADGPTIQLASATALQAGATLERILATFATRPVEPPRVLMSYVNPLLAYGRERLLRDLVESGFCGLIVPDLPLEEAATWRAAAMEHSLAWVPLVAPTSGALRAQRIAASATGFAYYVSVSGTTGVRQDLPTELRQSLDDLRTRNQVPIAVGFGIGDAERVRLLSPHCDGIVVGSRIIEAIARDEPLVPLIRELKQATKERTRC